MFLFLKVEIVRNASFKILKCEKMEESGLSVYNINENLKLLLMNKRINMQLDALLIWI